MQLDLAWGISWNQLAVLSLCDHMDSSAFLWRWPGRVLPRRVSAVEGQANFLNPRNLLFDARSEHLSFLHAKSLRVSSADDSEGLSYSKYAASFAHQQ